MKLSTRFILKLFLPLSSQHILQNATNSSAIPSNFHHSCILKDEEAKDAEIWISPMQTENHASIDIELPSYFESRVYNQHEVTDSNAIPLLAKKESEAPPHLRIYEHPAWPNWNAIWELEPLILDPDLLPVPINEDQCHGAQFRIQPEFSHHIFGIPQIYQGTTFIFKEFDNPSIRYVVEWCQWKDKKYAYLKVVGTRVSGYPYPYNHPQHPTFILQVPLTLSFVPFPPLMIERQPHSSARKNDHKKSERTTRLTSNWINRTMKNLCDRLG